MPEISSPGFGSAAPENGEAVFSILGSEPVKSQGAIVPIVEPFPVLGTEVGFFVRLSSPFTTAMRRISPKPRRPRVAGSRQAVGPMVIFPKPG